jgi:hypothetical protein
LAHYRIINNRISGFSYDGEVISSTLEHPFWVEGKGWTAAKELKAGSELLTKEGCVARVEAVSRREGKFKVYNFEVERLHTYFVSRIGILVHNQCAAGGGAAGNNIPATPFGRAVKSLKEFMESGEGSWRRIAAHAEEATGTSKQYRGATSIEEVFANRDTGERIVRHTIVKGERVYHETFRPYGKFGKD